MSWHDSTDVFGVILEVRGKHFSSGFTEVVLILGNHFEPDIMGNVRLGDEKKWPINTSKSFQSVHFEIVFKVARCSLCFMQVYGRDSETIIIFK